MCVCVCVSRLASSPWRVRELKGGAGRTKRMVEQETPCKKNRIAPLLRCGWGKKRKATKQKREKTSKTGSIARKKSHAHGAKKKPQSSCGSAREALRIIYLFPFAICSHFPSFPCVQGWERWSFIISTTTTTTPTTTALRLHTLCAARSTAPLGRASVSFGSWFVRSSSTHTHTLRIPPPAVPTRKKWTLHSFAQHTGQTRIRAPAGGRDQLQGRREDDALKHSQQHPFHAFHQQPSRGSSGNGGVKCAVRSRPPGRVGRIRKGMIDFNAPIRNERAAPRNVQMQTLLRLRTVLFPASLFWNGAGQHGVYKMEGGGGDKSLAAQIGRHSIINVMGFRNGKTGLLSKGL